MEIEFRHKVNESILPGVLKVSVQSYVLSKRFVHVMLKSSIFNIFYRRLPVNEKEIIIKQFEGIPYVVHKSAHTRGVKDRWFKIFCDWLPAIKDTIDKNYLKTLYVYMRNSENVIVETYRFHLKYTKDPKFSYKTADNKTPEEVSIATKNILGSIFKLSHVDKLGEDTQLEIEIILKEGCPIKYEPFSFERTVKPIHINLENFVVMGKIETGFHRLSAECSGLNLPDENLKKVIIPAVDMDESTDSDDMGIDQINRNESMDDEEQYDTVDMQANIHKNKRKMEVLNIRDDKEEDEEEAGVSTRKRFNNSDITVSDRMETSMESEEEISCICELDAPDYICIVRCSSCKQPYHGTCVGCHYDNPNFVFTCLTCRGDSLSSSKRKDKSLKSRVRLVLLCVLKTGKIPDEVLDQITEEDEKLLMGKLIEGKFCEPATSLSACKMVWPQIQTYLNMISSKEEVDKIVSQK